MARVLSSTFKEEFTIFGGGNVHRAVGRGNGEGRETPVFGWEDCVRRQRRGRVQRTRKQMAASRRRVTLSLIMAS